MILERIQGTRHSRVLPKWKGRTVALLAGGPSLTLEQVEMVRAAREVDRVRVIAINDSYLIAPWADVHYAADAKWHRWHTAGIDKPVLGLKAEEVALRWRCYTGQKCSLASSAEALPEAVHILKCRIEFGLSLDPEWLCAGYHGGFQALNIAILAGAKNILLLGYDAHPGQPGMRHWHGEHPTHTTRDDIYGEMRKSFKVAAPLISKAGVRVLNCSVGSAIEAFPMADLQEALEMTVA